MAYGVKQVARILANRDGLSPEDAADVVKEALAMVNSCITSGDFMEAEDIWLDYTGLEPDYLMMILGC